MIEEKACTQDEVDYINKEIHEKNGRFTNKNSQVLLFRNKLIAHNESKPLVEWSDVDAEMSLLIRMWSLLVAWSSFGLSQPFHSNEQAFLGLDSLFSNNEIILMKKERSKYLDEVKSWSKNYAHNGELDKGRGAFSKLLVK